MGGITLKLRESGIPDPEKEAELMVTMGTGTGRAALYRDNPAASEEQLSRLDECVRRRASGEPLQYILGEVEFHGLRIRVGPGVLIPRPETELLVEEAIRPLTGRGRVRALDLCTGSGCIALALARGLPGSMLWGTDTSGEALGYAEENARLNGITNVTFLRGRLFEPVGNMRFDLVASNPPYIKTSDIKDLEPGIRDWEPTRALDGGEDGLDFYRLILSTAPAHLEEGGVLLLELGLGQAPEVEKIADKALPGHKREVIPDYAGVGRIIRINII
jgi:release factor glutamine methyltransferase